VKPLTPEYMEEKFGMNRDEKRIIGLLILLLGLTALVVGIAIDQIKYILDFMREIFKASIAGLP
ncbi:MAG: hypothetical protein QXR59_01680, partial [Candidatus Bathyarchaeia archaeon]